MAGAHKNKEIKYKNCGKKTYRSINDEEICQSCYDKNQIITMENNIQISPNCSLGEISFEQFQGWFNISMSKVKLEIINEDILVDFKEEFIKQNAVLKKEIDKQKKDLEKSNNEITTLKNKVQMLEEKVESVEKRIMM